MFHLSLVEHLRLSFGAVIQNYEAHAATAHRLTRRMWELRVAELLLLAGTLAAALAANARGGAYVLLAAILAGLALTVFAVSVALNLESRIYAHRWCASRLWLIREKYRALLAEMADGLLSLDDVRERRDRLAGELQAIDEHAPLADRTTFSSARRALAMSGDSAATDEEIDAYLPPSLQQKPAATPVDATPGERAPGERRAS